MAKNTGIPYEKLTQAVFEALHAQQNVESVRVEQDVHLPGKTLTHQIDVYWEFVHGTITYRTIVQCKDWVEPVQQGHVMLFQKVLEDLPGQPRGIMVARSGFQEGARTWATAHGIILYELREPEDGDLKGYVRNLHLTVQLVVPWIHSLECLLDGAWAEAEQKRVGHPIPSNWKPDDAPDQQVVVREDGSEIETLGATIHRAITSKESTPLREYSSTFDEPAYVLTEIEDFPRLRITGIKVKAEVRVSTREMDRPLDTMVKLVLKDVLRNTVIPLDAQGAPLEPGKGLPPKLITAGEEPRETRQPRSSVDQRVDHDRTVFAAHDAVLPEADLIKLLQLVNTDQPFEAALFNRWPDFVQRVHRASNHFVDQALQKHVDAFSDALHRLWTFIELLRQYDGQDKRTARYIHRDIPANRFVSDGVAYVEHVKKLNALVAPVAETYYEYRLAVKSALLV